MHKAITKREKVIFYITLSVIIFSLVFNFFIAPILKKNSELNREIAFTRIKLKKYLSLLSQKDRIENRYHSLSPALEIVPSGEDSVVSTLSGLENMAETAGVKIVDIRTQATAKTFELYKEIDIDIRAEGQMESFLRYIYNIEHSLSLLRVNRLQFNAKPNSANLECIISISHISSL